MMQRPQTRTVCVTPGPRGGGFRTPPPRMERPGPGSFPSPPWAYTHGPYHAPRPGSYSGSPETHTPHREFRGGGTVGKHPDRSPGQTQYRPHSSPSYRHSPYQSPRAHYGAYQGSPRTSTPYNRERGANDIDKYYKPSMLQDPWANLQPVSVTQVQSKCSFQQVTHTGRTGRYYINKSNT